MQFVDQGYCMLLRVDAVQSQQFLCKELSFIFSKAKCGVCQVPVMQPKLVCANGAQDV